MLENHKQKQKLFFGKGPGRSRIVAVIRRVLQMIRENR
jgi:hypothetical protein